MSYVPKRGDIIWLQFNPQAGHEQAGRRPAFVLSPESYNKKIGLAVFCPITNQAKGYPFEVKLPDDLAVTGVILTDHLKSLDWKARNADFITEIPEDVLNEVQKKLKSLLL